MLYCRQEYDCSQNRNRNRDGSVCRCVEAKWFRCRRQAGIGKTTRHADSPCFNREICILHSEYLEDHCKSTICFSFSKSTCQLHLSNVEMDIQGLKTFPNFPSLLRADEMLKEVKALSSEKKVHFAFPFKPAAIHFQFLYWKLAT